MNPSRRTRSQLMRGMYERMKRAEKNRSVMERIAELALERAEKAERRTQALMDCDVEHVPWDHLRMFRVQVMVDAGAFRYHPQQFVDQLVRELPEKLIHEFNKASF